MEKIKSFIFEEIFYIKKKQDQKNGPAKNIKLQSYPMDRELIINIYIFIFF